MPSQSVRQNYNLVLLGNQYFTEDKKDNRPLDRSTEEVTIKIHSLPQFSAHKETQNKKRSHLSTAILSGSSDLLTKI